jgi:hypothetical protein
MSYSNYKNKIFKNITKETIANQATTTNYHHLHKNNKNNNNSMTTSQKSPTFYNPVTKTNLK